LLCRLGSDAEIRVRFQGDAHRESGVYQLCFSSKPGGVMLPPELDELTPPRLLLERKECKRRVGERRQLSEESDSCGVKLFYEKRFAQLVATDKRFHGAVATEEILNLAILINFLRGAQQR
jgi:hypothetical protein